MRVCVLPYAHASSSWYPPPALPTPITHHTHASAELPVSSAPPGAITTLGRGGSDLTATVLGAALELKEVQVWKDVDGAWAGPSHRRLSHPDLPSSMGG